MDDSFNNVFDVMDFLGNPEGFNIIYSSNGRYTYVYDEYTYDLPKKPFMSLTREEFVTGYVMFRQKLYEEGVLKMKLTKKEKTAIGYVEKKNQSGGGFAFYTGFFLGLYMIAKFIFG